MKRLMVVLAIAGCGVGAGAESELLADEDDAIASPKPWRTWWKTRLFSMPSPTRQLANLPGLCEVELGGCGLEPRFAQLSTGMATTCGVMTDHTLWCWGDNSRGQFGNGSTLLHDEPIQIGGDNDWSSVATAFNHTCAVKLDGSLWCWGSDDVGMLGVGGLGDRHVPVRVGSSMDWVAVATGMKTTCGVRRSGSLWCWGQLVPEAATGNRSFEGPLSAVPFQIEPTKQWASVVLSEGLRDQSMCAISSSGSLHCWSRRWSHSGGHNGGGYVYYAASAAQVDPTSQWASVGVAGDTTCGVKADGTLWCWSSAAYERFPGNLPASGLIQVTSASDWSKVAVGDDSACGLRTDGSLWCWPNAAAPPTRAGSATWSSLVANGKRFCARGADSTTSCWGALSESLASQHIPLAPNVTWSSIAVTGTGWHPGEWAGVRSDGTLWSWKPLSYDRASAPEQVGTGNDWSQVAMNGQTCALKVDGTLWCWGSPVAPTQIPNSVGWKRVSVGRQYYGSGYVCAIDRAGALWCWGDNAYGQLGIGTRGGSSTTPQRVGVGTDWVDVSAGDTHACALKTDGSLWCWGDSAQGGVGAGLNGHHSGPITTPLQIAGQWSRACAASRTSCGLASNGSVWCWGQNAGHAGGRPATEAYLWAPAQLSLPLPARELSCGSYRGCAVLTDGSLWCWGANTFGELGDGTVDQAKLPHAIGVANDWAAIAIGRTNVCALRGAGELSCTGRLAHGAASGVPVQVQP